MLKNFTFLSISAAFLSVLIGFIARVQDSRIFISTRSWLLAGAFFLLVAICFELLSIDQHLEKPRT
ncbi:MAG: hypothetical protein HY644_15265 [Acidobacteria bacterium]|nr:hypothetical protein [Acidobacteriota bacterium]